MLSPDQVPSQVEKIGNSRMSGQQPLGLPYRFEASHPSLPPPGHLSDCSARSLAYRPVTWITSGISSRSATGYLRSLSVTIFLGPPPRESSRRLKNRFAAAPSRFACRCSSGTSTNYGKVTWQYLVHCSFLSPYAGIINHLVILPMARA